MELSLRSYAYIGDAVWELFVREQMIYKTASANDLHKFTTSKVKASYQAKLLHDIENELTDEELDLVRRGRNMHIPIARRSNQQEYRFASAFEVLIGWWYKNDKTKLNEYFEKFKKDL